MPVNTEPKRRYQLTHSSRRQRSGIVLLIALGMLGLFSILVVTYVVFTSQARQASASIDRQVKESSRPQDLREQIITQVLVGSPSHRSATFGQDLLGDLYGHDSIRTRIAHRRVGSSATSPVHQRFRGELFDNPNTADQESTLFRFPLRFAAWNSDGSTGANGTAQHLPENRPGFDGQPVVPDNSTSSDPNTLEEFDDAYTGRVVTFLDGPLAEQSFRVVRSFGEDNSGSATFDSTAANDPEILLQYNLVIDLAELPRREIVLNGKSHDLWELARRFPMALLYGPGPDNAPGAGQTDDNGNDDVDELTELGTSGSDDIGYRLVINGQMFSGRGVDAGFAGSGGLNGVQPMYSDGTGWDPTPNNNTFPAGWADDGVTYALQQNSRFVGTALNAEPDEPYDAADLENLFLAWQPSDRPTGVPIHSGAGSAKANDLINQAIVPSYHRPALFAYLIQQPIKYNGTARTFAEIASGPPQAGDPERLKILVRRLRRACLRPLPFSGNGDDREDLDGDGEQLDGTPAFSGSNVTPILNSPSGLDPSGKIQEIQNLALWLANGPWDVDNDGDQVPDSIWVDFQLPTVTASDGSLIKPMVAPLIEDLDGRVNLNTAGTFPQMMTNVFALNPGRYAPDNVAEPTPETRRRIVRGFGVGPADVNPRLLLDPYNAKHFSWDFERPPTSQPNPFISLLNPRSTFAQVLSSRYGGRGVNFGAPGFDVNATSPGFTVPADDLVSQTVHPVRRGVHAIDAPMGLPMDMQGKGEIDRSPHGNLVVRNLDTPTTASNITMDERVNDPYELGVTGSPLGNDDPFTIEELVAVIQRDQPHSSQMRARLLKILEDDLDAGRANLDRKITVESRSQRAAEFTGFGNATDYVLSLLKRMPGYPWDSSEASEREAGEFAVKRMLALELRKGTKLNLNRRLGNGRDDTSGSPHPRFIDEPAELLGPPREKAYPNFGDPSSGAPADYVPKATGTDDFSDLTPQELLARNIYALLFALVRDPDADGSSSDLIIPHFPYPESMQLGTAAERERANLYAARRIAQWAVNVVDFRDHDAIMTRFRYDLDPFDIDGWAPASSFPANFDTVWGMEVSDLVLTEATAFHDMRVADTSLDDGANDQGDERKERDGTPMNEEPDADLDQLRIPQASAFVEIVNTRNRMPDGIQTTHAPVELYGWDDDDDRSTPLANRNMLDLGRTVGTGADETPVWRLAVGAPVDRSDHHYNSPRWLLDADRLFNSSEDPFAENQNAVAQDDVDKVVERYQHTADLELGSEGLLAFEPEDPGDNRDLAIDRVVWFADINGGSNVIAAENLHPKQVYRNVIADNQNSRPLLGPGQFAIVAPRLVTHLGQKTSNREASGFAYDPSDQALRIEYNANGEGTWVFRYNDLSGVSKGPAFYEDDPDNFSARGILPIIAQTRYPSPDDGEDWTDHFVRWHQYGINLPDDREVDFGFNISAPHPDRHYYPAPRQDKSLNDTPGPTGEAYPLLDAYYDAETPDGNPLDQPLDDDADRPLVKNGWRSGGTHQDAATVFLQRLADPTRPFDSTANPYISVDSISIDLTVFSGHEDLNDTVTIKGQEEPVDPETLNFNDDIRMDTRRKIPNTSEDRYADMSGEQFIYRALASSRQNILQRGTEQANAAHFDFQFQTGLGNANTYETGVGEDLDASATPFPETLGYLNREYGLPRPSTASTYRELVGMPQNTFLAVHPWYDRDYSSPYEIMSVPATSTVRMPFEFSPGTMLDSNPASNPPVVNERTSGFDHLLGFGDDYNDRDSSKWAPSGDGRLGSGPGFEQIFDFVDTGPIFGDGERWLEPTQTVASGGGNPVFDRVTETLHPPFNSIPLHRVPGKINLNTMPDYVGVTGEPERSPTDFDHLETPAEPQVFVNGKKNSTRYWENLSTSNEGFVGDGSVYQSLAWGYSRFRELDNRYGIPTGESEKDRYANTQDSPFGFNFKGFIESRTGFTQNTPKPSSPAPGELKNRQLHPKYPSRFVGVFAPASSRGFPLLSGAGGVTSVDAYLAQNKEYGGTREHPKQFMDMGLLRPHPDLDGRDVDLPPSTSVPLDEYDLRVEPASNGRPEWRSQLLRTPLFERTHANLHRDERFYDHIGAFRYRNAAKLANMTTHHSNVFLVRYTIGYFRVDPQSGEVGQEYGVDTGEAVRKRGTFVIDRTIPVGYEPGVASNVLNTVIFESKLE